MECSKAHAYRRKPLCRPRTSQTWAAGRFVVSLQGWQDPIIVPVKIGQRSEAAAGCTIGHVATQDEFQNGRIDHALGTQVTDSWRKRLECGCARLDGTGPRAQRRLTITRRIAYSKLVDFDGIQKIVKYAINHMLTREIVQSALETLHGRLRLPVLRHLCCDLENVVGTEAQDGGSHKRQILRRKHRVYPTVGITAGHKVGERICQGLAEHRAVIYEYRTK